MVWLIRHCKGLQLPRKTRRFGFVETKVRGFSNYKPIKMAVNEYFEPSDAHKSPLVIMHGLFGSKSNWSSLSKALKDKLSRPVISVDARNHGASPHTDEFSYRHMVEDVRELLVSRQLKSASLLGHSMGGRAVMLTALLYPDLVDKLVVVDISPVSISQSLSTMGHFFTAMKSIPVPPHTPLAQARSLVDVHLSQWISEPAVRQFLLTNLVLKEDGRVWWRINLDALEKSFNANVLTFPQTTSSFAKPTLFIAGTKSDYITENDLPGIQKLFPNSKIAYLDAGHWVHADKPHEFVSTVVDFLNNH